jgi:hypothetical protein
MQRLKLALVVAVQALAEHGDSEAIARIERVLWAGEKE